MTVIDYYVNLLEIQYNNLEKARATVALNIDTLIDDDIVTQVQNAFNLDAAVGKQLDVLGSYIGVNRFYTAIGELVGDYFGMTSYSTLGADTTVGLTDYANYALTVGGFATYSDLQASRNLDDDDYREILKLRIIQNNSNHSRKSIDEGLYIFFAEGLIASSKQNMSMVYFANGSNFRIALIAFAKGVLPRPMGVKLDGLIQRDKKIFGFTTYTKSLVSSGITGFTNYTDGFSKQGETLTYDKVINF